MALSAAASPSSPTPAPTLTLTPTRTYGAVLAPRVTDVFGADTCYNVEGLLSCANMLNGCYGDIFQKATNYNDAATSCFCASGMPYLNCYFNALSTSNCYEKIIGTIDWNSYMVDYFLSTCGSIPGTAMAQMKPPATVSLSFQTVKVVTFTGKLQPSPSVAPINFKGSGGLLTGECTATDFTLVDAGSTVYFAGFNGCNGDRPQCCPWSVATSTEPPPVTGGTNQDSTNRIGFEFPQPVDKNQAVLANCADDYYSISGGCCPVGYWLFTTDVGGQTPCYSSINRVATPPTLTAGLAKNPTDTTKPTSAVVNIIWSMRYPVADASGGLSTAAKAGIGAGAGVAAILIFTLAICLWRSRRKNKKLEAEKAANGGQGMPPPPMTQQAAIPNGQFGQYPPPPGTLAPTITDPSGRGSIMTNTTSISALSPLMPQSTGTSNGGASELSAQSGQGLLHNGSFHTGSPSPATPGMGYPPPIAEADEGQGQVPHQQPGHGYSQYGYFPQPSAPQQFPPQPAQPPFFPAPGQPYPQFYQGQQQQQQQFYGMPPQQPPPQMYPPRGQPVAFPPGQQPGQHPYYGAVPQQMAIPEMSARREADPPQEVAGSQVRHQ